MYVSQTGSPPLFDPELVLLRLELSEIKTQLKRLCEELLRVTSATNRCRICTQGFGSAFELEAHAKEDKHKTYLCDEVGCDKAYFSRDCLGKHKGEKHPATSGRRKRARNELPPQILPDDI